MEEVERTIIPSKTRKKSNINKTPAKVEEVWNSNVEQSPSKYRHLSYSQLSIFTQCKRQWYLRYVKKIAPYQGSIHAVFGTACHETVQAWLKVLYRGSVKESEELDVYSLLHNNLVKAYNIQKAQNGNKHFSTAEELQMFYLDGIHILDYLKKNRRVYFKTKGYYLAGVETLLYQDLQPGVKFKGYIDLILYHEPTDTWEILDIKTSTSGWRKEVKGNLIKVAQLLLYKEYFATQFNIDPSKITVKFFILKRRIPVEADYAVMQRRVQEYTPPTGKIKVGQALKLVKEYLNEAVNENGQYVDKEYMTNPSKSNCRFCPIKEISLCPDAV